MLGLMQQQPLLISSIIDFAERNHGDTEIVSRRVEGDIHRSSYGQVARRARQVANALDQLGLGFSERVATLAWNGYRHLELYFGVSGTGRVLHTLNPRLHPDQIVWIANHAEDRVLCFDMTFLPIVQAVHARCTSVKHWIALCEADKLPADTGIAGLQSYEALLGAQSTDYRWPTFDENSASSMCYTSGTTGNPKGVLYSHRSTVLHSYAAAMPDVLNCSAHDSILPVVPMFHANAWGLPYVASMVGAKMVFPGAALDGKSLHELFESERVTLSAGVPTIWQGLLAYMGDKGLKFSTMKRTVIGGAAVPLAMIRRFDEEHGVQVIQGWGMTEMSPLGTVSTFKARHLGLSTAERHAVQARQGRGMFGVEMKAVDKDGLELPWDGEAAGDLYVRGPWIASGYFKGEGGDPLVDGWFPTGDVGRIDAEGYLQITDRSKDVIKSGGEWISSIDVENIAMSHPAVAMAACIGVAHPKWDERPIVIVVKKPGADLTREQLLEFYQGKTAKFQIPDDAVFVDAIPLGATGKMLKTRLRETLKDYRLPGL